MLVAGIQPGLGITRDRPATTNLRPVDPPASSASPGRMPTSPVSPVRVVQPPTSAPASTSSGSPVRVISRSPAGSGVPVPTGTPSQVVQRPTRQPRLPSCTPPVGATWDPGRGVWRRLQPGETPRSPSPCQDLVVPPRPTEHQPHQPGVPPTLQPGQMPLPAPGCVGAQCNIPPTGQFPPGQFPGQFPPGQFPGQFPGQLPPGQFPGQMPTPGQFAPGQMPTPGQMPMPGQSPVPGQSPGAIPSQAIPPGKYRGCVSRFHKTRGTFSIYCPIGWVPPPTLGFFGVLSADEVVTPPPPPGTVKVADTAAQPPDTVPAGTEDTAPPLYKRPLFWIAVGGGALILGTGGYFIFRHRRN